MKYDQSGYFYPRSPRGERPQEQAQAAAGSAISIHAPREGSDELTAKQKAFVQISIHAPREGSDTRLADSRPGRTDFYPRSPRGERR